MLSMAKVLILGLGNILLRDEGLGVKLLQEMEKEFLFPEEVILHDGGTGAFFYFLIFFPQKR